MANSKRFLIEDYTQVRNRKFSSGHRRGQATLRNGINEINGEVGSHSLLSGKLAKRLQRGYSKVWLPYSLVAIALTNAATKSSLGCTRI